MYKSRKQLKRRLGQTTVEFAIVLPVLLVLLMGIIEFGRIWSTQNTITNAAREGCRRGVLATSSSADVEDVVANYLQATGLDLMLADVSIQNAGSEGNPGSDVTVTVDYQFQVIVGGILGMDATKVLSSTSVMRHE